MPTERQLTGNLGEDAAASHLLSKGFVVLRRNYHTRQGEVDIIARDAKFLLFVEVKARGEAMWGTPCEAVTPGKQRKIIKAAQRYMLEHMQADIDAGLKRRAARPLSAPSVCGDPALQPRFDVAEVYLDAFGVPRKLRWIQNAFGV